MRSIGTMWARGSGSTLPRKNVYPVLGEPLIAHALRSIKKSGVVDQFYVFTEDAEVASIVRSFGYRAIPRPEHLVDYAHPRWDPDEAMQTIANFVAADLGTVRPVHSDTWRAKWYACSDYFLAFNCNNVLMTPETLRAMRQRLDESGTISTVYPALRIEPPLYLSTSEGMWPILHQHGVDRQVSPRVFRVLQNTSFECQAR